MTTRNLVTTVVVTAACTLAVAVLDTFMPAQSAGVVYLAGVLYVSSRLGLWPGLATCALSALAFNFFFLPPRYTFVISSSGDWLTLALYGVTAVVTSGLAARVRDQAAEASRSSRCGSRPAWRAAASSSRRWTSSAPRPAPRSAPAAA
jgi:two-component system sensor histidine kinase KdpD